MSIFDTKPPIINKENIHNWLEKNYKIFNNNIKKSLTLNSERDFNLKIETKNKKKFVVKISNSSEDYKILQLQDSLLNYLLKTKIKNNIPRVIHRSIHTISDDKNRKCYLRILTYLDGEMFADKQENLLLCKNLSRFLGYLSLSLIKFKNKAAKRNFIWDSTRIDWIKSNINLFSDKKKREIIKMVLDSYQKNIKKKLNQFRYSIIHGDANNYNIVVKKNKITGLLDYGDSIFAPTVCELSVALAYTLMNSDEIIDKCYYMVKEYNSIYKLNKIEIEAISTLISTRLAITVTMAAIQKKKYPDNKYLTISEKDAWNLLYKLHDITLDKITKNLLKRVLI